MKKFEFFKVEGDKINRVRKHCPKCGPGVFIAEHKDRISCGKCGYTEYKGGVKPPRPPKPEVKPTEQVKEKPAPKETQAKAPKNPDENSMKKPE